MCLGLLLVFLGALGVAVWVKTEAAEAMISRWATAWVVPQVPGTSVQLDEIRFERPRPFEGSLRLTIGAVRWQRDATLLAKMDRLSLKGNLSFQWEAQAHVDRLELRALDQVLNQGRWMLHGSLEGDVGLQGVVASVGEVALKLRSQAPGGALNNALLGRLVSFMPQGESRSVLLKSVEGKPMFHFQIARVEMESLGSDYRLFLFLDGDHRIDVAIRVPKESVGLLKDLML